MTDEEIEKALKCFAMDYDGKQCSDCLNESSCPYNKEVNLTAVNDLCDDALDYIKRLKDERDYWKAQFEFQAEQDKNALMREQEIRKDTAKAIRERIEKESSIANMQISLFTK